MIVWTPECEAFLRDNYPRCGRAWCAEMLGFTEAQIRSKASRMGLKARGISSAWRQKQIDHAAKLAGRKRPAQALVIKRLHAEGKLAKTSIQKEKLSAAAKSRIARDGHPRGMLGRSHTPETKAFLSEKLKLLNAQITEEQWAARETKTQQTMRANGTDLTRGALNRKKASWKAGWREVGGRKIYFRSRWEANYGRYLDWLKRRGEISEWEHEPETFWFESIRRGTRSYLPDFRVTEKSGRIVYHEVKGWMDARSLTKLARMKKYYPSVQLLVIDGKKYKILEKQVQMLVEGWEA